MTKRGSAARLTVDMSSEEHMYLKMACAKIGITMREFMLRSAFEKMEELEDVWLAQKAAEILDRIASGEEKTHSWNKVKKLIG